MTDQMDEGVDDEFFDGTYGRVSGTTPSVHYVNESGEPDELIMPNLRANREIASIVEKWSQSLSNTTHQPSLDVFNRHRWEGTNHIHAQMSQCAWGVENDDILSTLADVLEGLAFQKCRFELFDSDQEDMWNQWAGMVDLDSRLREQYRELFKISQVYVGLWWDRHVFSVRDDEIQDTIAEFELKKEQREYEDKVKKRDEYNAANKNNPDVLPMPEILPPSDEGPGRGNRKRKKKFAVEIPTEMTIFDPTKVLPVGTLMFGRERFAYVASRDEDTAFSEVMSGNIADGTVLQLIESKYTPSESDKAACADIGADHNRLWLFKKDSIYRHSLTRAQYERYAAIRLKPILPILEMKEHLRASDRASLIGNTNFIVVITKGSDKLPAKPAEIANLQEQARVIARLPVLIGDHRLHVEIVSPALDNTLTESRWQTLDSRLVFKALQSFMPIVQGGNASSGVSEMSRVIARGIESRRHMLTRTMEKEIFSLVLKRNESVLDESPSLAFTPKRVTLDVKADVLAQILKLRDRGDLSRETMLEEMDYDQDIEVLRRARERTDYDRVFESGVPHSSPAMNPFATGGGGAVPPVPPPPANAPIAPKPKPISNSPGRPVGSKDTKPRQKKEA